MKQAYFKDMIQTLLKKEEVILFTNLKEINEEEKAVVMRFLKAHYYSEAQHYPYQVPPFNSEAALWAAEIVYRTAQLILYRENEVAEINEFLPKYGSNMNPDAYLSADLCLRFLPEMLEELKLINQEDPLIPVLEKLLEKWHFSGVNYDLNLEVLDFEGISKHPSLLQLYANRIIEFKRKKLAHHPTFKDIIDANLGIHIEEFWPELNN